MHKDNYPLVDLLHLSFVIRDSLEYCYEPIQIKDGAFEHRAKFFKDLIDSEHFIAKFLVNNPNENGKKFYDELNKYLENIYEKEFYVSFETCKADTDRKLEFLEETVKCFQTVADIMVNFINHNRKNEVQDETLYQCIVSNDNFYRTIMVLVLYTEIVKEDTNYKEAYARTRDPNSYENQLIVNLLKGYVQIYRFVKDQYRFEEQPILDLFDKVFALFQKLDGTIKTTYEEQQAAKKEIGSLVRKTVGMYEEKWREQYKLLLEALKNPSQA